MNVVPLDPDGHGAVQSLLPWYLTGRLAADEQAQVQAHLAGCPRCRAELALERQLQASLAAVESGRDVERDLAAMLGRLPEGVLEHGSRGPVRPSPRPAAWRWPAWRALAWRWAGGGLALAGVLAVVLPLSSSWTPAGDAPYRGLGSSSVAANAVVKFSAQATEAQIGAALRASGARLVGGPTTTQTYLLALPAADAPTLARLRDMPGVTLAESLAESPAAAPAR